MELDNAPVPQGSDVIPPPPKPPSVEKSLCGSMLKSGEAGSSGSCDIGGGTGSFTGSVYGSATGSGVLSMTGTGVGVGSGTGVETPPPLDPPELPVPKLLVVTRLKWVLPSSFRVPNRSGGGLSRMGIGLKVRLENILPPPLLISTVFGDGVADSPGVGFDMPVVGVLGVGPGGFGLGLKKRGLSFSKSSFLTIPLLLIFLYDSAMALFLFEFFDQYHQYHDGQHYTPGHYQRLARCGGIAATGTRIAWYQAAGKVEIEVFHGEIVQPGG